jgi:hypothetical protein
LGKAAALALMLGAAACGGAQRPGPVRPPPFRGPIVLLTLAALRADALEGTPSATPQLDRFMADATWSGTAVASASWCGGSLASVMTGLPPSIHGAAHPAQPRLRSEGRTLAEALSAAGFSTRGLYGSPWLAPGFGFERGFDALRPLRRRLAERRLATLPDGPSLTWIQLPAPGPTLPPETLAAVRQGRAAARQEHAAPRHDGREAGSSYRRRVAGADRTFGRLLGALRRGGRLEQAIVVVLADHGESREDGPPTPGHDLGRASVEVPLGIRLPAALADRLAVAPGGVVGLDRLHATLLELAGLEPLPAAAPSLLRPDPWVAWSELWFGDGYHEIALYEDRHQLRWRCRFAPPEPDFEGAWRDALDVGGAARYGTLVADLERRFRDHPSCGLGEELRLESWPERGGVVTVDDAPRLERMLERLRALRSFPPAWSVQAPAAAPRLGRHGVRALGGWGLPVPAQWGG